MSKSSLRHTSFVSDPRAAARQAAENARDANELFLRKVTGYLAYVPRYGAVGSTGTKIRLPQLGSVRPVAVLLARAFETNDPGGAFAISGNANFYHDSSGIGVYEPSGLTADVKYDLTFLILE